MDNQGRLTDLAEVFVFTDNYHAEAAFFRGTAKSPKVLALMLRLHVILMKGQAFVHIVWVSGKQMIDQGTDGLSRSNLTSGVMQGVPMLRYVPVHLSVLEWQPIRVREFLDATMFKTSKVYLTPHQWFTVAQDSDKVFM
ncbi:hypothetical protein ACA910_011368 [Epithemia clementina (nom. ined.)]